MRTSAVVYASVIKTLVKQQRAPQCSSVDLSLTINEPLDVGLQFDLLNGVVLVLVDHVEGALELFVGLLGSENFLEGVSEEVHGLRLL